MNRALKAEGELLDWLNSGRMLATGWLAISYSGRNAHLASVRIMRNLTRPPPAHQQIKRIGIVSCASTAKETFTLNQNNETSIQSRPKSHLHQRLVPPSHRRMG